MIRPATIHDVDEAERIYDEVLDYEAEYGTTTNWVKGKYPTRKTAEKALAAGTYYVGEDETGRIYGTVNLNHIQPAEYGNIPWTMPAEGEEVLVVHTLCVRPDCRGKGYAKDFSEFFSDFVPSERSGLSFEETDSFASAGSVNSPMVSS